MGVEASGGPRTNFSPGLQSALLKPGLSMRGFFFFCTKWTNKFHIFLLESVTTLRIPNNTKRCRRNQKQTKTHHFFSSSDHTSHLQACQTTFAELCFIWVFTRVLWSGRCLGLNCAPPPPAPIHILKPNPQCNLIWRWDLRR